MLTIGWIIFAGLTHFNAHRAFDLPLGAFSFSRNFFAGLGSAMLIAAYDIGGYYNVCFLGDEVKEPAKNIPRASVAIHSCGGVSISSDECQHFRCHSLAGTGAGGRIEQ